MNGATEFNFPIVQYILDAVAGSLATLPAEGKLLLQNYEPLRKGLWNTVSPVDSILSEGSPSGKSARVL